MPVEDTLIPHKNVSSVHLDGAGGTPSSCSSPFLVNGEKYIYVEMITESGAVYVRLFREESEHHFSLVTEKIPYQLHLPQVSKIGKEFVLTGSRAVVDCGKESFRYTDVYRGSPDRPYYFSASPNHMKVVLAESPTGGVAAFSVDENGSLGLLTVPSIEDLTAESLSSRTLLGEKDPSGHRFEVQQIFPLSSSLLGGVALQKGPSDSVGEVVAFVYHIESQTITGKKVIASPSSIHADRILSASLSLTDKASDLLYCCTGNGVWAITIDHPFSDNGEPTTPLVF